MPVKNFLSLLFILTLLSCDQQKKETNSGTINSRDSATEMHTTSGSSIDQSQAKKDISWMGYLQKNVPVFIHYQKVDEVISGEIIYLNTAAQKPIKLIGTIDEGNNYRLLEFENSGNITGIITGKSENGQFVGNWFSPRTRKSLDLKLTAKDTSIVSEKLTANTSDLFGTYNYQYSKEGNMGTLSLEKLGNGKAIFSLNAVTSAPARNLADIEKDTVDINQGKIVYKVPYSENCEITVMFYKGFAHAFYSKGPCDAVFGHNATAEGIFLK